MKKRFDLETDFSVENKIIAALIAKEIDEQNFDRKPESYEPHQKKTRKARLDLIDLTQSAYKELKCIENKTARSSADTKVVRVFRKLLAEGYLRIKYNSKAQNTLLTDKERRNEIISDGSLLQKRFDGVFKLLINNNIKLQVFNNSDSLYQQLNNDLVKAIDSNIDKKRNRIGVYLGPTVAKLIDYFEPDSQLNEKIYKRLNSSNESYGITPIFAPSIGLVESIKPTDVQTMSSNLIAFLLNKKLYNDTKIPFKNDVIDQPAFVVCPPEDIAIMKRLKEYLKDKNTIFKTEEVHTFLMSLGSNPSRKGKGSQHMSFREVYRAIDSNIDLSKSNKNDEKITAEILGHYFNNKGVAVGDHYPDKPKAYSHDIETLLTNASYKYLGVTRDELTTIAKFINKKDPQNSNNVGLGVCAILTHPSKAASAVRALIQTKEESFINRMYVTTDVLEKIEKEFKHAESSYIPNLLPEEWKISRVNEANPLDDRT